MWRIDEFLNHFILEKDSFIVRWGNRSFRKPRVVKKVGGYTCVSGPAKDTRLMRDSNRTSSSRGKNGLMRLRGVGILGKVGVREGASLLPR